MKYVIDRPIEKRYTSISELSEMIGVPNSTIIYWESLYPHIRSVKRSVKQSRGRLYTAKEVADIKELKRLLHNEGFTHRGVQIQLEKRKEATHA